MKHQIILVLSLITLTLLGSNLSIQATDLHPTLSESPLAERSPVDSKYTLQTAYSQAIGQDDAAYHFQYNAAHYSAYNDAHDLDNVVDKLTVTVAIAEDIWQMTSNTPASDFTLANNRLTIHRNGYDEWYINGPMGLQQGFTLYEPSDISFIVGGTLATAASEQSLSIGEKLTFSGLMAFDAEGMDVSVEFDLHDNRLAYVYDDTHATYPLTIDPWVQRQKLTASDSAAEARFGSSVALNGDTALIGAVKINGTREGSAYVFVRSGATWSQQAKLLPSNPADTGDFGSDLALDRDPALIRGGNGVYVFGRSGNTWTEQTKLITSDGWDVYTLAVDDDTALFGSRDADDNGYHSGAAYVFVRSGATWSQQAKLLPYDGEISDYFGTAVALDGDTAIISAVGDECDNGYSYYGSAYVFGRSGTSWTQQRRLVASARTRYAHFGASVALDNNTILIGAPGLLCYGGTFGECGKAYVFVGSGFSWSQQAILEITSPTDTPTDYFGTSVALEGDSAFVGADGDAPINSYQPGTVTLFERTGTVWSEKETLLASDGHISDGFGNKIAVDGETLIVGATVSTCSAGYECGSAYVFTFEPPQALVASAVCNGPNLEVTITGGDGPFNITASAGINMPVNGVTTSTTTIFGPEKWDDVTITETTGDLGSLNLGQFKCRTEERPVLYWPEHQAHTVNRRPTFVWGVITDANDYRLFLFDDANAAQRTVDIRENSSGATSYVVQAQLPLGRIFWRVRARTNRVWGLWSVRRTLFVEPVVIAPAVQLNAPAPTVELSTPLPPNSPPDNGPPPTSEAPPSTELPAPPNSR